MANPTKVNTKQATIPPRNGDMSRVRRVNQQTLELNTKPIVTFPKKTGT